jgi:hypothetical protein
LIISFVYIRHGTHGCIIRILQNSQMGELKWDTLKNADILWRYLCTVVY